MMILKICVLFMNFRVLLAFGHQYAIISTRKQL